MYFPLLILHSWGKRSAAQPQTIYSEVPLFWGVLLVGARPVCFRQAQYSPLQAVCQYLFVNFVCIYNIFVCLL